MNTSASDVHTSSLFAYTCGVAVVLSARLYDRRARTLIGKPSKRERNRVGSGICFAVFAVTVYGRGGIEFFRVFFPHRPENATRVLFAFVDRNEKK